MPHLKRPKLKALKITWAFLILFLGFQKSALSADWPEGPWINGNPNKQAIVSAVAFVSPSDLQFARVIHIWHRLEKKYGPLNVDFLIVAMQEPLFPFSQEMVEAAVKEMSYGLPVLIDAGGRYSKLWRAYVSPTVNLVLQDGKVTSFDPGNFDPFVFEKALQKILKESGVVALPAKEYPNDVDLKNCHTRTLLVGTKFQKAWAAIVPTFDGTWNVDPFWAEKTGDLSAQMDFQLTKSSLGLTAESKRVTAKVNVLLDDQKVPAELRGRDLQEDRLGNTFVNVSMAKTYEILAHGAKEKENPVKVTLTSETSGLKIWAVQMMPACLEGAL